MVINCYMFSSILEDWKMSNLYGFPIVMWRNQLGKDTYMLEKQTEPKVVTVYMCQCSLCWSFWVTEDIHPRFILMISKQGTSSKFLDTNESLLSGPFQCQGGWGCCPLLQPSGTFLCLLCGWWRWSPFQIVLGWWRSRIPCQSWIQSLYFSLTTIAMHVCSFIEATHLCAGPMSCWRTICRHIQHVDDNLEFGPY